RLCLRRSLTRNTRNLVTADISTRREPPRTIHQHTHSEAGGLAVRQPLHPALTRRDRLAAVGAESNVCVLCARTLCRIQSQHCQLLRERIGRTASALRRCRTKRQSRYQGDNACRRSCCRCLLQEVSSRAAHTFTSRKGVVRIRAIIGCSTRYAQYTRLGTRKIGRAS